MEDLYFDDSVSWRRRTRLLAYQAVFLDRVATIDTQILRTLDQTAKPLDLHRFDFRVVANAGGFANLPLGRYLACMLR